MTDRSDPAHDTERFETMREALRQAVEEPKQPAATAQRRVAKPRRSRRSK